ncbi:MAG: MCE family protein [Pedosphaera sp.]|nr:MCE family protein [Pedosphaera sp.]
MAVQDLTPQLRTRLGRLERLVGLFVTLATLLLLAGLTYYVYHVAQRKGWFLTKAPYFTYLHSAAGLKVGDTVKLMGFDVGEITQITAEEPGKLYDVYVEIAVRQPYYGYIWTDSKMKVKAAGLLGSRYLELTKGDVQSKTPVHATYKEDSATHRLTGIWDDKAGQFTNFAKGTPAGKYYLLADEPPELADQLDQVVQTVKGALPNFLALTNQLTQVLSNAATATARLDEIMISAKPAVTNLQVITANLRDPKGSLGEWLFPTNMNQQITLLLTNANTITTNVNTNLVAVVNNLNLSLANLASITSNLNAQVQANTNILTGISRLVVDTDTMVQGLKRHWLLRSAFKDETKDGTNAPPVKPVPPKGGGRVPN